ncbi:hypothetical protein DFH94DRAFT_700750 [Russula ochroleuca]|uniref:Uncharacterized protein n=1 Tax=Russula ochroleuca TaxID=152965 RepID=A0A9P5N5F9_9AGAM|nr:hypothetical protein DFH94DRAFT_700750 [Russula ochroleuca]
MTDDESRSRSTPEIGGEASGLNIRISHLLDTRKNPRFASTEQWLWHTRACIEATALLVCRANAKLDWFGDNVKLLGDIGSAEKTHELSTLETDRPFVIQWTCLSLVTIRSSLERNTPVQEKARIAVESLAGEHDSSDGQALKSAQNIDGTLQDARGFLSELTDALIQVKNTKEQVIKILGGYGRQVSQLENIKIAADHLDNIDQRMSDIQSFIVTTSQRITRQLPGVQFDDFLDDFETWSIESNRLVEWSHNPPRQFIFPGQTLKGIHSLGLAFRTILDGTWDANDYQETLKDVKEFLTWRGDLLQRQLWRLQDLRDGGGLGFTVELYFLALKQPLSIPSLEESESQLCIGTLQAITSNQTKHRHSLGTQKLLLDMILPHGIISEFRYPAYITDVFFNFLGEFLEGQGGPHLDDAMQKLSSPDIYTCYGDEQYAFRDNTLRVVKRARAPLS